MQNIRHVVLQPVVFSCNMCVAQHLHDHGHNARGNSWHFMWHDNFSVSWHMLHEVRQSTDKVACHAGREHARLFSNFFASLS